jgi:hypothetical protein
VVKYLGIVAALNLELDVLLLLCCVVLLVLQLTCGVGGSCPWVKGARLGSSCP